MSYRSLAAILAAASAALATPACNTTTAAPDAGVDAGADAGYDAGADAGCAPDAGTAARDCTAGACALLTIAGDEDPAGAPQFHGFADPTVRRDPDGGHLWLGYSRPYAQPLALPDGGSVLVNTVGLHLARSDDGGGTWSLVSALFPARQVTDPQGSGQPGFINSETLSLTRVTAASGSFWASVRLSYFLLPQAGSHPDGKSFHLRVSRAASPDLLAGAPEQVLGGSFTDPAWLVDVNLNALDPALASCGLWNDPVLFFDGGKLYLGAGCFVFSGGLPDDTRFRQAIFVTTPSGPPATWVWRYTGSLADHDAALALGVPELMQIDLVRGVDGQLLALLTPSCSDATGLELHDGCRALEVASLDPPLLGRRCDGTLAVRASATGTDQPKGTGSCGYDPASATGLLLARRADGSAAGFTIVKTGLKP